MQHQEMKSQAKAALLEMSITAAMLHVLIYESGKEIDEWFAEDIVCKCGQCDMEAAKPFIEIYRQMIHLQVNGGKAKYSQYMRWMATLIEAMEANEDDTETIMRAANRWGTDPCNN